MIILEILKIIGIVIASIIGLIIFILLLLCLCPIQYKVSADKKGEVIRASAGAVWLFGLFHLVFDYKDKKPDFKIRIFGKNIIKDKQADKNKKPDKANIEIKKTAVTVKKDRAEKTETASKPAVKQQISKKKVTDINKKNNSKPAKEKKNGISKKIKSKKKETLKKKMRKFRDKFLNIKNNISKVKNNMTSDEGKAAVKHVFKQLFKILKHMRPRKARGECLLGLDSPDQTAMAYALASNVSAILGNSVNVFPDMENKVIDFDITLKGFIVTGYILKCFAVMLLNKNVFGLIKKFRGKENG